MVNDVLWPLLAGLGLFFVGVTLVSDNLKRLTSRRLRQFFARFTSRDWQSALLGGVTGFVTQSSSVSAFIVAGLISSGLMTVRRALPVIFWANAGCSVLVILAVLDIRYLVYVLLFLSGLVWAFERPRSMRVLSRVLFGVGLLFLGLMMIRSAASPLAQMPWVREAMAATGGSWLMALALGVALTVVTQTALGVVLIAISLTHSGLFTLDQTAMIIFGAHLGSSVVTWILAAGLKGTPRQMVMAQVLFNALGVLVLAPLYWVERRFGVPLVMAVLARVTPDLEHQMVGLVVVFNWVVPLVCWPLHGPLARMLGRFWPPTEAESLAQLRFIRDLSGDTPDTALDMVEQEQGRLLGLAAEHLRAARARLEGVDGPDAAVRHAAFQGVAVEVRAVLDEMAQGELPEATGARLLGVRARLDLLEGLEGTVFDFARACAGAAAEGRPETVRRFLGVL
ncbi:MAG: Na/Pi cotransporter family protein, partial [Desulfovibrionaceae bacterium]